MADLIEASGGEGGESAVDEKTGRWRTGRGAGVAEPQSLNVSVRLPGLARAREWRSPVTTNL